MIPLRAALRLPVHLYRVWRGGQARFRVETFGVYHPALPYERPVWKMRPAHLLTLLRQVPSYVRWVRRLEDVRVNGADGWWADEGYDLSSVVRDWNR